MGSGWGEVIVSNSRIYTESSSIVLRKQEVRRGWRYVDIVSTFEACMPGRGFSVHLRNVEHFCQASGEHAITCCHCLFPPVVLLVHWEVFYAFLIPAVTIEIGGGEGVGRNRRVVHGRNPKWQKFECFTNCEMEGYYYSYPEIMNLANKKTHLRPANCWFTCDIIPCPQWN